MAVNDLNFEQASAVLTEVYNQATGQKVLAPVTAGEFVTVATTALKTGYDALNTAISQVLSRTIFSIRPYYRKFPDLYVDQIQWGNHVRKLNPIDGDIEDDSRFELVDGQSIDPWVVNSPKVLQTNFYGGSVYQRHLTIYKDQLDQAFQGPEEFSRFISMVMQNALDQMEQVTEAGARMALANFAAGIHEGNPSAVVHLLTEYNAYAGTALTAANVHSPENWGDFSKWLFARIKTASDFLTERSALYHINITNKEIMRHTPREDQRIYLQAPVLNNINTEVLSGVFNDSYMRIIDHESANFWQSISTPDTINVTPTYLNAADGTLTTSATAVTIAPVVGMIFDREAVGITRINEWSMATPMNPRGGYTNYFWHFTTRWWNDFTENGLLFVLD